MRSTDAGFTASSSFATILWSTSFRLECYRQWTSPRLLIANEGGWTVASNKNSLLDKVAGLSAMCGAPLARTSLAAAGARASLPKKIYLNREPTRKRGLSSEADRAGTFARHRSGAPY